MFLKKFSFANLQLLGAMLIVGLPLRSHANPDAADAGPSLVSISPIYAVSFETNKFTKALLLNSAWSKNDRYVPGVKITIHDANIQKIMSDFTHRYVPDSLFLPTLESFADIQGVILSLSFTIDNTLEGGRAPAVLKQEILRLLSHMPALKFLYLKLNKKILTSHEVSFWAIFLQDLKQLKNFEDLFLYARVSHPKLSSTFEALKVSLEKKFRILSFCIRVTVPVVPISPSDVLSLDTKKFASALIRNAALIENDEANRYTEGVKIAIHATNINNIVLDFTNTDVAGELTLASLTIVKEVTLSLNFTIDDTVEGKERAYALRAGLLSLLFDLPALKALHLRFEEKILRPDEVRFLKYFIQDLKGLQKIELLSLEVRVLTSACASALQELAVNVAESFRSVDFDVIAVHAGPSDVLADTPKNFANALILQSAQRMPGELAAINEVNQHEACANITIHDTNIKGIMSHFTNGAP